LKALLARKRQFKTILIENSLEGASIPCPKKPIRSVQQKTESSKNLAYIWVAQKRGAPKPGREPSREIIRMQGVHTFEVRKNSYQPRPLSRKESACPKNRVIADDMLPLVVTPSSAGMA
jgi:hypothetical protein